MVSSLVRSFAAVFVLPIAGASVLYAQAPSPSPAVTPAPEAQPKRAKKLKKPQSATQLEKAESGSPHSVLYKPRDKGTPNPTNDQLGALESEAPASVDYANRKAGARTPTNAEVYSGEKVAPDAVQTPRR